MSEAPPRVATIVLAGGSGTRLGLSDGTNKVYLPLEGRPLLAWSISALYETLHPAEMVLVVREGDEPEARAASAIAGCEAPRVVTGGATRTESEIAGVLAVRESIGSGDVSVVLVHDGARPFPSPAMLRRLVQGATEHGAAVPGLRVDPGLVRRDASTGSVAVVDTEPLRALQTPQAFDATTLLAAAEAAALAGADTVDTASLVASHGGPPAIVVEGDPSNIKVTRPDDLPHAAAIARSLGRP